MSDIPKKLSNIASQLLGTVYPKAATRTKWDDLPPFDELPEFKGYKGCAWGVWGEGDELGTVNLLTEDVVREAAAEEIKTGQAVPLNWPVNFPEKPCFNRKSPGVTVVKTTPDATWMDDELDINTQSGSQWDGMKHFGVLFPDSEPIFYQNNPMSSFKLGSIPCGDPLAIDKHLIRCGIHNWAQHGICGRAVFLDVARFLTAKHGSLPYDAWTTHAVTLEEIKACVEAQGVTFKPADILILRVGFMQKYYKSSKEERDALSTKRETFAGIEQSEDMKRFLWNNHFAAIASDQPALERWPPPEGTEFMHSTLLGLWGMPIGEFFDLEKLSDVCASTGRYSFFFTSWPLNILGGCASPPNAAAIF